MFAIFADGAEAVEGLSLDEAFVAIAADSVAEAVAWAARVRARVRSEVGLTSAPAWRAERWSRRSPPIRASPTDWRSSEPGTEAAFLAPLSVSRLWGIGPKTQSRLEAAGMRTIGDVAALDDVGGLRAARTLGPRGTRACPGYRRPARGRLAERKSISTEETFEYDLRDEGRIIALLRSQADEIAADLARLGLRGRTIGVKIKARRFQHLRAVRRAWQCRPIAPSDIFAAALYCWQRSEMAGKPIRLLGTRVAVAERGNPAGAPLFGPERPGARCSGNYCWRQTPFVGR